MRSGFPEADELASERKIEKMSFTHPKNKVKICMERSGCWLQKVFCSQHQIPPLSVSKN